MLKEQKLELDIFSIQQVCDEIRKDFQIDLINKYQVMQQISPAAACENNSYSLIHKSIYEFFIAQSIIQETLKAKLQAID